MYHREQGRGEPLVLLHGLLATGGQWQPQIKALQARHRVLAPDLRGHGRMPLGEGFHRIPEQLASDVLAFLDHLGVDAAHLVGTGMAPHAALALALRAPHRAHDWVDLPRSAVHDYLQHPVDFPDQALAHLNAPVLMVQGDRADEEREQACTPRTLQPRAKLAILLYAGTLVHLERPDIYNQIVLDFLNRLDTVL